MVWARTTDQVIGPSQSPTARFDWATSQWMPAGSRSTRWRVLMVLITMTNPYTQWRWRRWA